MRPMPDQRLEKIRQVAFEVEHCGACGAGTANGVFVFRTKGAFIRVIASADEGEGWEHVSVSLPDRCPTWAEMCLVKGLFWLPEEAVMQLHPPESDYVNNHAFCLHLWRPTTAAIPLPPAIYVGVKDAGLLKSPEHARQVRAEALRS